MKKIKSIKRLINWNNKNSNGENRFLFRGESNCDYHLIPKISRGDEDKIVNEKTASLRINKLREYLTIRLPTYGFEFNNANKTERNWKELFIAQHYGAPTQLLDFTRNPMTALFFACEKDIDKKDGVLYSVSIKAQENHDKEDFDASKADYNIASYDLMSNGKNPKTPYDLEEIKFIVPPQFDNRIKNQDSVFCCFPRGSRTKILNEQLNQGESMNYLRKWIIPKECKKDILDELNRIGINHSSLFPDMIGFGNFVSWKLFDIKD